MTDFSPEFQPSTADFAAGLASSREQMVRMARKMRLSPEDAEDVVQQVHLKAWERRGQFEGRSKLTTWLASSVINQAIDHHRASRTEHEHPGVFDIDGIGTDDAIENPHQALVQKESAKVVLAELEDVPTKQRAAVLLRVIGFKHVEIASLMGVTFSTAKTNTKRGLDRISDQRGLTT